MGGVQGTRAEPTKRKPPRLLGGAGTSSAEGCERALVRRKERTARRKEGRKEEGSTEIRVCGPTAPAFPREIGKREGS